MSGILHDGAAEEGTGNVLYQSERSLVVRVRLGRTYVIRKETRGRYALQRVHHELAVLERLADVPGVAHAILGPPDALLLEEIRAPSLTETLAVRRLDVGEVVDIAERLARTLAMVHRIGIVHRDISPSNILIASEGPILIDFDLAALPGQERPAFADDREIVGNLTYMAPEQSGRTGRGVDQRADLYALGAVLYEAAVGRPPFEAEDLLELVHEHLVRIPTPPKKLDPNVPSGLSAILLRLLEKDPDRRYQSAEGLMHDLAALRKALAQGMEEFGILGRQDFPLRLSPPSHLVGREAEMAALREAFETALREKQRGIFITGPAGVGKTALVHELRSIVAQEHGWFVSGKFDQYRNDADSGAVFQALRSLARFLLAESEAKLAWQRAAVLQALGSNASLVTSLIPELSALLGELPDSPGAEVGSAESRLRLALLTFLRSIASLERPIVLVLDDLQWADPSSIGFIEEVLNDEDLRGLLLVGVHRDVEHDAAHPLGSFLSRWEQLGIAPPMLRLGNLSMESLGNLLGEMLRLSPTKVQTLAKAVGEHTKGNPYDTVELVNELRSDQVLVLDEGGWSWDEATVRRHIGRADVIDLLSARISRLPQKVRELLFVMACIGGQVEAPRLLAASGIERSALDEALPQALEFGLVVIEQEELISFRHDRVQQAAYLLLGARQEHLHLEIARRFAADAAFSAGAAQQYLAAMPSLTNACELHERRRMIGLFREGASRACLATDYLSAERFLARATELSDALGIGLDDSDRLALEWERYAVLYSLGRYDEADVCYAELERRTNDPIALADAACRQITALFRRRKLREAILLGVDMLRRLGREPDFGDAKPDVSKELDAFYHWFSRIDLKRELTRPEPEHPGIMAALGVMQRLQMPAIYADPVLTNWLTFESQRLWESHGPCALLVTGICTACATLIELRGDYRMTYDVLRFAITVGEVREYEPATSWARCLFATTGAHWAEPLEECLPHARRAYERIVLGGDVQQASHSFHATYTELQECAGLDVCASEVEAGLTFALRTGGGQLAATFNVHRQLMRALYGETSPPGSLNDVSFEEERHVAELAGNVAPTINFHLNCAMLGAIFGDAGRLIRHADAVQSLLATSMLSVRGMYRPAVLGNVFGALALAERLRAQPLDQRLALLAEFDEIHAWFTLRAGGAPMNYAHLASWLAAERAWIVGDVHEALSAFDTARQRARKRPWHHALITERAGLFYLEQGATRTGHMLLTEAYLLYERWGASGKTRHMQQQYPFLSAELAALGGRRSVSGSGYLSSRNLDLLAILRASQTLSSETDIDRLRDRIVELLGTMTGATKVSIVLRQGEAQEFVLLPAPGGDVAAASVEAASAGELLPLSAFRYALRSREPLLVSNALADDRFSEDPYFKNLEQCSLFVVPILSQGAVLAVLLLENHVGSRAFSEDGLDAVKLIVGQLAFSLENALLYTSLAQAYEREKRVAKTFQEAALDPHLPVIPGIVLDAVYHPGCTEAQVGGDWYDTFRLPDGRIVLSVGDVSGSGLQAAVAMASVRQSIRTAALINPDPVAILEAVDRIVRATEREQFVTAFVGVLDPLFFELMYANAGHPPPLLRAPDGSVQALLQNGSPGDLPLGLRLPDEISSASLIIEPGSILALYTDGLLEFERDVLVGEKKLLEAMRKLPKLCKAAPELYRCILGEWAQSDDVAILTLAFDRPLIDMQDEGLAVRWDFDANDAEAAHAKHREFASILERLGFTPTELSAAELVFGELLGNVVRYTNGQATIILDMSAEAPVLHVLDRGDGFEHNRRLPKDIMSEHGRGLFLVSAFAEDVSISRRKRGGSHARVVLSGRIRLPHVVRPKPLKSVS